MTQEEDRRPLRFDVEARDGEARAGRLATRDGEIATPVFIPVGTRAAVKHLAAHEAREAGASILLANTYHLVLRPGVDLVERAGGIGRFMGWDGPVLTDSGGFQVFSLARTRKIDENGVRFRSHIDGAPLSLTPESAWDAQRRLGATIAMQLDVCPPGDADAATAGEATRTTTRWLDRTVAARGGEAAWPALFGIVQGGTDVEARRRHLEEVAARPVDGVALGGLSVGEERERTDAVVAEAAPRMPAGRPRYLMGMGTPRDILHAVACGVDMFDCVLPTRGGRHGQVFTSRGAWSIKLARWKESAEPLDPACGCAACARFERRYLRHLYTCGEPLAARLITLHNVAFYCALAAGARRAIAAGDYAGYRRRTEEAMREEGGER